MNLDQSWATSSNDRRHNFVLSGRVEVLKLTSLSASGMLRALSGEPFTIQDTSFDNDQNTIFLEPLDPGTYSEFPEAGAHVMTDVESDGG